MTLTSDAPETTEGAAPSPEQSSPSWTIRAADLRAAFARVAHAAARRRRPPDPGVDPWNELLGAIWLADGRAA